jgi:hypothetical protein
MLERRFSAAELAEYAQLPVATVTFYVTHGILKPSIQRGRGRGSGHVFSYGDVLAAMTLNALRLPNAATGPLQQLVTFWRSERGEELLRSLHREGPPKTPRLLFITEKGVDVDGSVVDVMEERKAPIVFCLDAAHFAKQLMIHTTESQVLFRYAEPGPFGRVPRKVPATTSSAAERPRRNIARESVGSEARPARDRKKKAGNQS